MAEVSVEKQEELPTASDIQPVKKSLNADAFQNFLQGKRHLLVKDYTHAVQSLSKACELHIEHYGDMASECAEVYFHYGKALFRLYQEQAGIFGDTAPEGSGDEEEEEEEEEENAFGGSEDEKENDGEEEGGEDDKDNEENNDAKEDDSESVTSSKDDEKVDTMDSTKPSVNTEDSAVSPPPDSAVANSVTEKPVDSESVGVVEAGPSTSTSKPSKSEDEISDLQLAWEILETARSIFQKQGEDHKEAQMKIAEILSILGEISLENDLYDSAIKDLQDCLNIWDRYLGPDDRRKAETYYQLGLAYQLKCQSSKAIESFQKTIDIIQLRIDILKKQTVIQQNEDGFDIDPKLEIADLESLLPDIKMKIEDTKELDKETKKAIEELHAPQIKEVAIAKEDAKPVMNISHLLKRKKPETDRENANTEEKKRKLSSPPQTNSDEQRQSASDVTSPPRA